MPPFGWSPTYDDAYITLTSAQALWTGAIPGYPDTPVLHGITSPAHLVLVAALLVFVDPLTALWLSQALATLFYASGLRALGRSMKLSSQLVALFLAIGLAVGMTPYHLFNGLETGLALGAVTWTLALGVRRHPSTPIALATLPFVRPEFALLSVAIAAWWLLSLPRSQWGRSLVLMASGAIPWAMFLLWQTGTILPGTAQIKSAFLGDACWPLSHKGMSLAIAGLRWLAALGPGALFAFGLRERGLPAACGIAFLLALAAYAYGLPSHLPRYHEQRYLYGWLPVMLLGGMSATRRYPKVAPYLLLVIAVTVVVRIPSMLAVHRGWADPFHREQEALVSWLETRVPRTERLMVIDAGYLAFASRYGLVDVVGLKSPASARQHILVTGPSCGAKRGESLSEIAEATGARYFVPWGEWEQRLRMADALRVEGWHVQLLRQRPAGTPDDWWYPVYVLRPPETLR